MDLFDRSKLPGPGACSGKYRALPNAYMDAHSSINYELTQSMIIWLIEPLLAKNK